MIVVVTGGRDYTDRQAVYRGLDHYHKKFGISMVVEGGADGADQFARFWAIKNHIPYHTVEAEWEDVDVEGAVIRYHSDGTPYNAAAGGMRNQKMIDDYDPKACVFFPGGRGTNDMKDRARRAGLLPCDGLVLK